jgi:hypothetical protein
MIGFVCQGMPDFRMAFTMVASLRAMATLALRRREVLHTTCCASEPTVAQADMMIVAAARAVSNWIKCLLSKGMCSPWFARPLNGAAN